MRRDVMRGLDRWIEGEPPDPGSVDDGIVPRTCADCGRTYDQHDEDEEVRCNECAARALAKDDAYRRGLARILR